MKLVMTRDVSHQKCAEIYEVHTRVFQVSTVIYIFFVFFVFFYEGYKPDCSSLVDLELHSLLLAMTNKEWPEQYVGQVECVCVWLQCVSRTDFETKGIVTKTTFKTLPSFSSNFK